ncbi:MAG: hypothetical protein JNM84_23720 [Planctomycetes bacterium]|nr:hypothetical protein [Planctomycetota bacterium]
MPRRETYAALRSGADALRLRHVLDRADAQGYYSTLRLQIGFSIPGSRNRLPEWLVGLRPLQSVVRLISDPELRSESFRSFWSALRALRRDVEPAVQLRVIARSPWSAGRDLDELATSARSRREQLGIPELLADEFEFAEDMAPAAAGYFEHRLFWRLGSARPELEVCARGGLPELEQEHALLHLVVGGVFAAALRKRPDGTWQGLSELRARCEPRREIPVELRTRLGVPQWFDSLSVWDEDQPFAAWRAESGEPTPIEALEPGSWILRLDEGLNPTGEIEARWREFVLVRWDEASAASVATEEGAPIWSMRGDGSAKLAELEFHVVQDEVAQLGRDLRLRMIDLPPDFVPIRATLAGRAVSIETNPRGWQLLLRRVGPLGTQPSLRVHGRLGGSGAVLRCRTWRPRLSGAAFENEGGSWSPTRAHEDLQPRLRHRTRLAVRSEEGGSVFLIEGATTFERRLSSSRPRLLPELRGHGATLSAHPQRWNRELRSRLAELGALASCVSPLGDLELVREGRERTVVLRSALPELPDGLKLWIWRAGEAPTQHQLVPRRECSGQFVAKDDVAGFTLAAAAIEAGVCCTSRVWPEISRLLGEERGNLSLLEIAALLRWLRAPLRATENRDTLARFVDRAGAELLRAWVGEEGLSEGLRHDPMGLSRWDDELGEILLFHPPTSEALLSSRAHLPNRSHLEARLPFFALRLRLLELAERGQMSAPELIRAVARVAPPEAELERASGTLGLAPQFLLARLREATERALGAAPSSTPSADLCDLLRNTAFRELWSTSTEALFEERGNSR